MHGSIVIFPIVYLVIDSAAMCVQVDREITVCNADSLY